MDCNVTITTHGWKPAKRTHRGGAEGTRSEKFVAESTNKCTATTKHTKATKVSKNNTLEYFNFVLFATFVVRCLCYLKQLTVARRRITVFAPQRWLIRGLYRQRP
jgi:hypothetical protein